jgi:alkanesulfonate monooxygenase SsuD/methylene tetrahydromethanopterin reductase-like flavin-dependent oxidoreductase (luciferase family)
MLAMSPYPGFDGRYFKMECRNIVPKPVQKPHPPLWMACTNRDTIKVAAQLGVGALAFSYIEPDEAGKWVKLYYDTIMSDDCVPLGHAVNARVAMVSGLAVSENRAQAVREGYHCSNFFRYALQSTILNDSVPGFTNLWGAYMAEQGGDAGLEKAVCEAELAGESYMGASGTPQDVAKRLAVFESCGVDDILFTIQGGNRSHANICQTLDMFSRQVMPRFNNPERRAKRDAELAPYIARAMARKNFMRPLDQAEVPVVPGARSSVTPEFEKLKIG